MNRKQLIIFVALVAVLGATSLVLVNRNKDSWSSADSKLGRKVLEKLPINDVAAIHLIGDGELNLVKKNDRWCVQERGNYPANFTAISGFLLKLADLKVAQSEQVEPSQLASLQLLEPGKGAPGKTASVIELKDANGKVIQALLLGLQHTRKSASPYGGGEYPDGRYVMVRGDSQNALLISDPLGGSDPKPEQWLNKDFFHVDKIKSIAFTAANPTNSWTLVSTNETGSLTMSDCKTNEVVDPSKISSIGATLSNPTFVDVATNLTSEKAGLDKPLVLTVDTFNHFNYIIKVGNKTPENNYYVTVSVKAELPKERVVGKDEKPEDKAKLDKEFAEANKRLEDKLTQEKSLEKWTYLVSSDVIDPLVRDRAQLMREQEQPKGTESSGEKSGEEQGSGTNQP